MMPPELVEVLVNVQEQLGEQIELLDREGPAYIRRYAEAALLLKRIQGPKCPAGMHPKVSAMVRELIVDELLIRRHARAGG